MCKRALDGCVQLLLASKKPDAVMGIRGAGGSRIAANRGGHGMVHIGQHARSVRVHHGKVPGVSTSDFQWSNW